MGYVKRGDLELARQEIASIANAIGDYEPVWLYAKPRNIQDAVKAVSDNVTVKPLDVDQLWIRDIGPIFVVDNDGNLAGVDTNFNYWGSKIKIPDGVDPAAAKAVLENEKIPRIEAPLTFEGGGVEFDGGGTLLATESSMLNKNRNPGKTRLDIEKALRDLFSIQKIIWVRGAKSVDVTDFHVDSLARFGPDDTVILSRPNDAVQRSDVLYSVYQQAKSVLSKATNAAGRPLRIVEIEEARTVPRAIEDSLDPGEICTSYVNFYLANDAVIIPQFGDDKTDAKALEVLNDLWPTRDVVPVTLNWMAYAGGGVHCATQQWPSLSEQETPGMPEVLFTESVGSLMGLHELV